MKKLPFILVLSLAVTPGFAVDFPALDEWEPSNDIMTFGPSNLWEHINGAAETYLQYGFEELVTAEVSRDGVTVAVGIYSMGTPLNAFGIYRTERPEDGDILAIGAQAVVSAPYQAVMVKDRFYVKVDVYDGEIDAAAGAKLLEIVAAVLPGSDGMPEVFTSLPADNQVPGSQRFTREAFLGVRELTNCASAEYEGGTGEPIRIFVMLPPTGGTVDGTWKNLAGTWKPLGSDSGLALMKKVPYTGYLGVVRQGDRIIGIAGSATEDELRGNLKKHLGVAVAAT